MKYTKTKIDRIKTSSKSKPITKKDPAFSKLKHYQNSSGPKDSLFLSEIQKKYKNGDKWLPFDKWEPTDLTLYLDCNIKRYKEMCDLLQTLSLLSDDDLLDTETASPDDIKLKSIELSERVIEYLLTTYTEKKDLPSQIQRELFPVFIPSKSVEVKKEFMLNFGSIERIEKDYKHLLSEKLTSGRTLKDHLDEVKKWFNSLTGEDLGNWIKLFGFAKSVREFAETNPDTISSFKEITEGKYLFRIKTNKVFFSFFIRPDKKSGQFTTKAKNKFLKWLSDNQKAVTFPLVINGELWTMPLSVYSYAEKISHNKEKDIMFEINTNILDSEFKSYASIDIKEIDEIADLWETETVADKIISKYHLNSFVDIPLKFLLTLKNIYSPHGNFQAKNNFLGNKQTLSRKNLNKHLGGISERIQNHLVKRDRIRPGTKKDGLVREVTSHLLKLTLDIAQKRNWIFSYNYDSENGIYHFYLNPGYFARQDTAKRLKQLNAN